MQDPRPTQAKRRHCRKGIGHPSQLLDDMGPSFGNAGLGDRGGVGWIVAAKTWSKDARRMTADPKFFAFARPQHGVTHDAQRFMVRVAVANAYVHACIGRFWPRSECRGLPCHSLSSPLTSGKKKGTAVLPVMPCHRGVAEAELHRRKGGRHAMMAPARHPGPAQSTGPYCALRTGTFATPGSVTADGAFTAGATSIIASVYWYAPPRGRVQPACPSGRRSKAPSDKRKDAASAERAEKGPVLVGLINHGRHASSGIGELQTCICTRAGTASDLGTCLRALTCSVSRHVQCRAHSRPRKRHAGLPRRPGERTLLISLARRRRPGGGPAVDDWLRARGNFTAPLASSALSVCERGNTYLRRVPVDRHRGRRRPIPGRTANSTLPARISMRAQLPANRAVCPLRRYLLIDGSMRRASHWLASAAAHARYSARLPNASHPAPREVSR